METDFAVMLVPDKTGFVLVCAKMPGKPQERSSVFQMLEHDQAVEFFVSNIACHITHVMPYTTQRKSLEIFNISGKYRNE